MGRLLFCGLVFLIPRLATACSCVSIASGCDRSWIPKETAFLGRVTAMEKTGQGGFLSSYAARFVVDENFSGAAAGSEVTVYTGMGGGDCGYPFKQATKAQIALAWLLAQKPRIVPIPGTTKLHRLRENLGGAEVELTPEDLKAIHDAISGIEVQGDRYPAHLQSLVNR